MCGDSLPRSSVEIRTVLYMHQKLTVVLEMIEDAKGCNTHLNFQQKKTVNNLIPVCALRRLDYSSLLESFAFVAKEFWFQHSSGSFRVDQVS